MDEPENAAESAQPDTPAVWSAFRLLIVLSSFAFALAFVQILTGMGRALGGSDYPTLQATGVEGAVGQLWEVVVQTHRYAGYLLLVFLPASGLALRAVGKTLTPYVPKRSGWIRAMGLSVIWVGLASTLFSIGSGHRAGLLSIRNIASQAAGYSGIPPAQLHWQLGASLLAMAAISLLMGILIAETRAVQNAVKASRQSRAG